jgi:hypothetical protein
MNAAWQSCCLAIPRVERSVHFLPRDGASAQQLQVDARELVNSVADTKTRSKFTCHAKVERLAYVLGERDDVPTERRDWIVVCTDAECEFTNAELLRGTDKFQAAVGTSTSRLHTVMVEARMQGAACVQITRAQATQVAARRSWCRREYVVTVDDIRVISPPPQASPALCMMAIKIRPRENSDLPEIHVWSQRVSANGDDVDNADHATLQANDLVRLLESFVATVTEVDPDVWLNDDFIVPLLRLMKLSPPQHRPLFSRLGRLKRADLFEGMTLDGSNIPRWSLDRITSGRLRCETDKADTNTVIDANRFRQLVRDGDLVTLLELARVIGMPWSCSSQLQRVDFLLMHQFHRQQCIVPPKGGNFTRRDIGGGETLPAKVGLYNAPRTFVALLDFSSHYPSIIAQEQICFAPDVVSVLPTIMRRLIEERGATEVVTRRAALKLAANCVYGCIASHDSRFYSPAVANAITAAGRLSLTKASEIAGEDFEVIMGVTDSLMVVLSDMSTVEEATATANNLIKEIGKMLPGLQMKLDSLFSAVLIRDSVCYVAKRVGDGAVVKKGVRPFTRQYSQMAHDVGDAIVAELFAPNSNDDLLPRINAVTERAPMRRSVEFSGVGFAIRESQDIHETTVSFEGQKQRDVRASLLHAAMRNNDARVAVLSPDALEAHRTWSFANATCCTCQRT